jgi:sugar/nucleoside kinase (ribokinase family)
MPQDNKANELAVIAIGNALVDVLAQSNDDYLQRQNMTKGSMMLVDADRALALYNDMTDPTEMAGGSAGNTMACFASLGGKGGYIGKVAKDNVGASFINSLQDLNVAFQTPPLESGVSTGRCMILVTPDGERTMNTFLGAAVELTPNDIDEDFISKGQVIYLEGYLFDPPQAMEAFIKAARLAHEAGREVAFTLSDSFCVDRHREAFKDFIDYHVDILFANEDELKSLYETDSLEDAISRVSDHCSLAAITRSENGSIIVQDNHKTRVKADPVAKVIDSTGAGDAYAAGFLFGYTQGKDIAECGRIGSIAAAEVISHMGPRPETNLAELVSQKKAA